MIRAKKLHEVLAGRLGGGVRAAMLINHDGALLGAASIADGDHLQQQQETAGGGEEALMVGGGAGSKEKSLETQVMAAITSHIWSTYEGVGFDGQPLDTLMLDLSDARVVILPAGNHHLIALVGAAEGEMGLLLAKTQTLAEYLRECLRQITVF